MPSEARRQEDCGINAVLLTCKTCVCIVPVALMLVVSKATCPNVVFLKPMKNEA